MPVLKKQDLALLVKVNEHTKIKKFVEVQLINEMAEKLSLIFDIHFAVCRFFAAKPARSAVIRLRCSYHLILSEVSGHLHLPSSRQKNQQPSQFRTNFSCPFQATKLNIP